MTLKDLLEIEPFNWPLEGVSVLRRILVDRGASEEDRTVAAACAGEIAIINDLLAADLLSIVGNAGEPEGLRAMAAIALGPILEQCGHQGFDDPAGFNDQPISEETFNRINRKLHEVYADAAVPKQVRRRVLEAAVRSPEVWLEEAVREAYTSGDRDWKLTAVFTMRFVKGFEREVMESLRSSDPEILTEAVHAAGAKELDQAWAQVAKMLTARDTPKDLLLAAIEAAGSIRPEEAHDALVRFSQSHDEDIADAAREALMFIDSYGGDDDDNPF